MCIFHTRVQMACANTGIEKLSVILISVIPFSATLVTANPLLGTPYTPTPAS